MKRLGALFFLASALAISPVQAATDAPLLNSPDDGITLPGFSAPLKWSNPAGTTQLQQQVVPSGNDGPGLDIHLGSADTSFTVPAPPAWYGLLPDMTYTWRVRVSAAASFVGLTDPAWSPWVERRFRTPPSFSYGIAPLMPVNGEVVSTRTPVIRWKNSQAAIFYYEFQLSKDASFTTDPLMATAMVYSALLHAGVSKPDSSYAVPVSAPLEDGITYYWRVRPRVQGDGAQVSWSAAFDLRVQTAAAPSVKATIVGFGTAPTGEVAVDETRCQMTRPQASYTLSPRLTEVAFAYRYSGSGQVFQHVWADNGIFTATPVQLSGNRTCQTGRVTNGNDDVPLPPGAYHAEIWLAGGMVATASFNVDQLTPLQLDFPIAGAANPSGCHLDGVGSEQARGTVFFRWNTTGAGTYTWRLTGSSPRSGTLSTDGPVGCQVMAFDLVFGDWKLTLTPPSGDSQAASVSIR